MPETERKNQTEAGLAVSGSGRGQRKDIHAHLFETRGRISPEGDTTTGSEQGLRAKPPSPLTFLHLLNFQTGLDCPFAKINKTEEASDNTQSLVIPALFASTALLETSPPGAGRPRIAGH